MASGNAVENESKVIILIPLKIFHNRKETSHEQERCSQFDCQIPGERLRNYCRMAGAAAWSRSSKHTVCTAMAGDSGKSRIRATGQPDFAGRKTLSSKSFAQTRGLFSASRKKKSEERGALRLFQDKRGEADI